MAKDFSQSMSEAIASARPRYSGGGGGGVQVIPLQNLVQKQGWGQLGLNLGKGISKGFKERYDFLHNPERIEERAEKTWQVMAGMEKKSPELMRQMLSRPDVQAQIKLYMKQPQGRMFWAKREDLGGLVGPVTSDALRLANELKTQQIAQVKQATSTAGTVQKGEEQKQKEIKDTADIRRQAMEDEYLLLAENLRGKALENDQIEAFKDLSRQEKEEQINNLRARTGAIAQEVKFKNLDRPKQIEFLANQIKEQQERLKGLIQTRQHEAQAFPLKLQYEGIKNLIASGQLQSVEDTNKAFWLVHKADMDKMYQIAEDKRIQGILDESHRGEKAILDSFGDTLVSNYTDYAVQSAKNVKGQIADNSDFITYNDRHGNPVDIPISINSPALRGSINMAFEKLYSAFLKEGKSIHTASKWETLKELHSTAKALWEASYGRVASNILGSSSFKESIMLSDKFSSVVGEMGPEVPQLLHTGTYTQIQDKINHMVLAMHIQQPEAGYLTKDEAAYLSQKFALNPPGGNFIYEAIKGIGNLFKGRTKEQVERTKSGEDVLDETGALGGL